ncbi:hypothetical protein KY290_025458 [Solanum tuberosum]|uniref:Flavin-containing monooxygenase n=1 Tax=Solanum tuberosum TaxID=4113 RepID=A0ABQ7UUU7_SOLTU|nr:hypothetical protein KY290_025458 [Solanum tuberosum]
MAESRKVAVIGAGASGLVTARELRREGHRVVVFEKSNQLGGLWVYNPRVETDLLSLDPNREIIHSSLYKSLRTNLPRQLMSFSDYSFDCAENVNRLNFPGHEEVLKFLNEFAKDFGINELIRFNTEVVRVAPVEFGGNHWIVESKSEELSSEEIVVVIGDGPSGHDISRDIATVAKQVHLTTRSSGIEIDHVDENGEVIFIDGSSIHADIILHCTGYKYDFPFLQTNGIAIVFLMFELQAKWIAQVLSGKVRLPTEEEMLADVEDHNRQLEESGIPKRHTHRLHPTEIEYIDWLAARVEMPPIDAGLTEMYWSIYKFVGQVGWSGYRDLWNF